VRVVGGGFGDGMCGGRVGERADDVLPADDGRRFREELLCWRSEVDEERDVSSGERLFRSVDRRAIEGISLIGAGVLGT
jgi:hypothetical protein